MQANQPVPARYRRLRFPPPPPVPPRREVYSLESRLVPPPLALLPLLRADEPGVHYALILRMLFGAPKSHGGGPKRPRTPAPDLTPLRLLLERNCVDPAIAPLVRELVPVAPCQWCGRPYLHESERRSFCRDRCRRLWVNAGADERAARPATWDKEGNYR
jgi:endogenous inhibitor of DNA gyrase (YacG/DUF329 family)